jgi:hypothetical protein
MGEMFEQLESAKNVHVVQSLQSPYIPHQTLSSQLGTLKMQELRMREFFERENKMMPLT